MAGFSAGALHLHTYTQVESQMVRELKGDGNAAVVASRLSFRLEGGGDTHEAGGRRWWRAPLRQIADETGLSPDQVKRSMKKLLDGGFVEARQFMAGGITDRTISYSIPIRTDDAEPPLAQASEDSTPSDVVEGTITDEHGIPVLAGPTTTTKTSTRGTRLNPSFIPSEESRKVILAEHPNLDLRAEHTKFVDHFISQPGQRGVKVSWDATWRNWMRKAAEYGAGRTNGFHTRSDWQEKVFADALAVGEQEDQ